MKKVKVVKDVLKANEKVSEQNRKLFAEKNITVMNMIGSPGAGKTTLLEGLLKRLTDELTVGVVEGDIFTTRDAERIENCGVNVVQINTGGGCHLDAVMVQDALESFDLGELDFLIIENVGNLVCPAAYNLGEEFKMVVMSITEGDDKPEKYPRIFQESEVLAVTKTDLLEYNNFDMNRFLDEVEGIRPGIEIFKCASLKGKGLDELAGWIKEKCKK